MGVKINLRIITKNHEADPEIGFLTKPISKRYGRVTAIPPASKLILIPCYYDAPKAVPDPRVKRKFIPNISTALTVRVNDFIKTIIHNRALCLASKKQKFVSFIKT